MREITYTEAVLEAFREEMRRDPTVFHLCGGLGTLASLIPEFGEERVRVCPISEDAYVGASIGAAGSGFRPIVSPGMMTFAFTAMDQIVNQMAKIHYIIGIQSCFVRRPSCLPHRLPCFYWRWPLRRRSAFAKPPSDVHESGRPETRHAGHPI